MSSVQLTVASNPWITFFKNTTASTLALTASHTAIAAIFLAGPTFSQTGVITMSGILDTAQSLMPARFVFTAAPIILGLMTAKDVLQNVIRERTRASQGFEDALSPAQAAKQAIQNLLYKLAAGVTEVTKGVMNHVDADREAIYYGQLAGVGAGIIAGAVADSYPVWFLTAIMTAGLVSGIIAVGRSQG